MQHEHLGFVIWNKPCSPLEELQVHVDERVRSYLEERPHSTMDASLGE